MEIVIKQFLTLTKKSSMILQELLLEIGTCIENPIEF